MDYNILLDFVTDLGYRLAMSGAETFRVEDTINRITMAYGVESEVFAIPNCLTVSIETSDGRPKTRMRRIGYHGNDLDAIEKYNSLSRRVCMELPTPTVAVQLLRKVDQERRYHSTLIKMMAYFIASFGYSLFFRGSITDGIIGGICGLLTGFVERLMDEFHVNQFFRTILSAFMLSILAYSFDALGCVQNVDGVIIGALMLLVPGLLFTNAMRDIIYGDTNSGLHRIVQVLLVAMGLALGSAVALQLSTSLYGAHSPIVPTTYNVIMQNVACYIGGLGFCIIFNIHGWGMTLCAIGSCITWSVYLLVLYWTGNELMAYLWGAIAGSAYSEIMARIRHCPATAYLVVSIFPLIPGAGVFYTMQYAVNGDMQAFADKGTNTAAIAGAMAMGIILVSTLFRMLSTWQANHTKKITAEE